MKGKKGKRKNKDYNYMVGLMPSSHSVDKSKNLLRKSKHMSLKNARRKGEKVFNRVLSTDPEGADVMIFKKKKGKYKPHSYYTGEWESYD